LGHATRDLAIASELRAQNREIEISWLASSTAGEFLAEAGERLLSEAGRLTDENTIAEGTAQRGFRLNLPTYVNRAKEAWAHNAQVYGSAIVSGNYDLVIGDEAYELVLAVLHRQVSIRPTLVAIYDFLGLDSMTGSLLETLTNTLFLRKLLRPVSKKVITNLFVGEEEDIPDRAFGFLLPNRRKWARKNLQFLGYVVRFNPADLKDRAVLREELGYGEEPLVICSVGGTAVGREMLELCGRAYPLIRESVPDLRMVLVCGPRLAPESMEMPAGIEVKGYVAALHRHFAASDLAIVQGGGTSTIELTALRRPFLYFPLQWHYEQQIPVAGRVTRHGAGVKMQFLETTPKRLAEVVVSQLGKEVDYLPIRTDGAQNAARIINQLL